MILAAGAILLAGTVLLRLGWRRRVVDDHPLCRKCGYDLFGKPADSTRCSECGTDVTSPQSVRIGHRAHRWWLVRPGLILMIAGLALGTWGATARLKQVPWIQYEPLSWVLKAADSTTPTTSDPAKAELMRRLRGHLLSPTQTTQLLDHVLDVQADLSRIWDSTWSDFILAAQKDGKLTEAQVERFVQQGILVQMKPRPVARRGGRIVAEVGFLTSRLEPNAFFSGSFSGQISLGGALINPRALSGQSMRPRPGYSTPSVLLNRFFTGGKVEADAVAKLADGPQELRTTVRFDVTMEKPFRAGPFSFARHAVATVNLVPSTAIVDRFEAEPASRPAMAAAVPEAMLDIVDGKVAAEVRLQSPPMALAVEVVLSRGGEEQSLGTLRHNSKYWPDYWEALPQEHAAVFTEGTVDVILRPSQAAAESELALGRYWGEPIVLHGVPVRPAGPRLLVDESLRKAVEAAVHLEPLLWSGSKSKPLQLEVEVRGSPVRLSYDVILRSGTREVVAGDFEYKVSEHRGMFSAGYLMYTALPAEGIKTVDVVLRPRTGRYGHPASETAPWGGTITFRDVPLPPPEPATQPAQ